MYYRQAETILGAKECVLGATQSVRLWREVSNFYIKIDIASSIRAFVAGGAKRAVFFYTLYKFIKNHTPILYIFIFSLIIKKNCPFCPFSMKTPVFTRGLTKKSGAKPVKKLPLEVPLLPLFVKTGPPDSKTSLHKK